MLQQLIHSHDGPVAGLYIRAHSNLPGPLTKLNATADVLTRSKHDLYPVHFPPKNRVEVTPPPQSLSPKQDMSQFTVLLLSVRHAVKNG